MNTKRNHIMIKDHLNGGFKIFLKGFFCWTEFDSMPSHQNRKTKRMLRRKTYLESLVKNKVFGIQQINVTIGFRITKGKLQALDGVDTFERFKFASICYRKPIPKTNKQKQSMMQKIKCTFFIETLKD